MIISRTPYRLSFFGGGTDYPQWYLKEGGAVLSTTIDKYCYVTARYFPPFFHYKHRVVWSHIEVVPNMNEILHPSVREALRLFEPEDTVGYEIHHAGDLPARTGIGSSSSLTVGLLNALSRLKGQNWTPELIANKALHLEQEILKENVGSQDQVAAAIGGLNVIRFRKTGEWKVEPVNASPARIAELESRLLMVYTGTARNGGVVAGKIIETLMSKAQYLKKIVEMVDKGVEILLGNGELDEFGKLLHETWSLKKQLSEFISSPTIETTYKKALGAGAIGGKLMGAGSAGFMYFYVPHSKWDSVTEALSNYVCVPFKFENSGTSIIHDSADPAVAHNINRARLKLVGT